MPLKTCLQSCRRQWWQGGHTTHVAVVLQLSQNKSMMTPITQDNPKIKGIYQLSPIGKRKKPILTINMPQKTCLPCCCRQWWQRWQGGHTTRVAIVLWLSQNKIRMIKVKTTWKKGKANSDNWHATKSLPSVLSTATVARRAYHPRRRCPSAFPKQINDDTNHWRSKTISKSKAANTNWKKGKANSDN